MGLQKRSGDNFTCSDILSKALFEDLRTISDKILDRTKNRASKAAINEERNTSLSRACPQM